MNKRGLREGTPGGAARIAVAALLLGTLGSASTVWAHRDPATCTMNFVTAGITLFRFDGVTPISGDDTVTECETIFIQGTVQKPAGDASCAFEGGKIFITTPDGMPHDVTPPGGVPCLGGTDGIICTPGVDTAVSLMQAYVVTAADKGVGFIAATASYGLSPCVANPGTCGTSHSGATDQVNKATGGTGGGNLVEACEADTDCTDFFCDPNLCDNGTCDQDSIRKGLCTFTDRPDSTPCTETDGDKCTTAGCNGAGTCDQSHLVENCDDNDPCTDDSCDVATGLCVHTPSPSCVSCGSIDTGPCLITVDKPPKTFVNLQRAVNGASNGATITVQGTCTGFTRILKRSGLTIQGIPPTPTGCPVDAKEPTNLTSTLKGSPDDIIKVIESSNIVIRFLNIVEASGTGVELKRSSTSAVNCNCIARNGEEGVELHAGSLHVVSQNLVTQNIEDGIRLPHDTKRNNVHDNTSTENGLNGISLEGGADDNVIDGNTINGNADGLVDLIRCFSGSGNTGSNVTPACQ